MRARLGCPAHISQPQMALLVARGRKRRTVRGISLFNLTLLQRRLEGAFIGHEVYHLFSNDKEATRGALDPALQHLLAWRSSQTRLPRFVNKLSSALTGLPDEMFLADKELLLKIFLLPVLSGSSCDYYSPHLLLDQPTSIRISKSSCVRPPSRYLRRQPSLVRPLRLFSSTIGLFSSSSPSTHLELGLWSSIGPIFCGDTFLLVSALKINPSLPHHDPQTSDSLP